MEETLLENLRRNQAFDAALKKGKSIDDIIAAVALSLLMEQDNEARAARIAELERKLVRQFQIEYQPAAHTIAGQNVAKVLKALPSPPTPNELATARQTVVSSSVRDRTRVEIVRANVNDAGNSLNNQLRAYRLEPGPSQSVKTSRLIERYRTQETKRLEYDRASESFNLGETDTRPRKPQLEFTSRFAEDVKGDVRVQSRRAGTDAETAAFAKAGYTLLAWCTVNAAEACPDCRIRHGAKGDLAFWDLWGRPGSGQTICGGSCFCLLIPESAIRNHPGLKKGLNTPKRGVLTSPAEAMIFNERR